MEGLVNKKRGWRRQTAPPPTTAIRYLLVKITAHVRVGGVAGEGVRKNHRNLHCGLLTLLQHAGVLFHTSHLLVSKPTRRIGLLDAARVPDAAAARLALPGFLGAATGGPLGMRGSLVLALLGAKRVVVVVVVAATANIL